MRSILLGDDVDGSSYLRVVGQQVVHLGVARHAHRLAHRGRHLFYVLKVGLEEVRVVVVAGVLVRPLYGEAVARRGQSGEYARRHQPRPLLSVIKAHARELLPHRHFQYVHVGLYLVLHAVEVLEEHHVAVAEILSVQPLIFLILPVCLVHGLLHLVPPQRRLL